MRSGETLKITGSGCAAFFAPTEAAVRVSSHDGEVWFVTDDRSDE